MKNDLLAIMMPGIEEYNQKLYQETGEELRGIFRQAIQKELDKQKEEFIEKACKWLYETVFGIAISKRQLVDEFRKAMDTYT